MVAARPQAVLMAAGSGKRFVRSGGAGYKQLIPYKGEPVVARLVRQIEESGVFAGTQVVLGTDPECRAAVQAALAGRNVTYRFNPDAGRDKNLLSFRAGTQGLDAPILLIEADCVVSADDLIGMVDALCPEEIRWSEVGNITEFKYGGLIETDPVTGLGVSVDVLDEPAFTAFKTTGRQGVKMFGLTAFGADALSTYRARIDALADPHNKYFHHIAIREPGQFRLTTYRMAAKSFTFNTISEFSQADD